MAHSILIVDDEAPIRFALARYFGAKGCAVDTAATIEEATRSIARTAHAVAIVDLRLAGGATGFEVVAILRAYRPETKILMLTAYGSPEVELLAEQHGVDALLSKPKPLAEISSVLERLLDRPRTDRPITTQ